MYRLNLSCAFSFFVISFVLTSLHLLVIFYSLCNYYSVFSSCQPIIMFSVNLYDNLVWLVTVVAVSSYDVTASAFLAFGIFTPF